MNMKKSTALIAILLIVLLMLSGCVDATHNEEETIEQMEVQSESQAISEAESTAASESDKSAGVGDEMIYEKIEPKDAKAMIDDQTVILIDVRTEAEYAEGHIANSVNIPLDVIETEIESYVSDQSQPIMVYCRSGNRSAVASGVLKELGYQVIYDLGGIQSWPYDVEK